MTLTKEQITTILVEEFPYLLSEYGVSKIGLFGSYAKGTSTALSDVDIIVAFERPIGFKFMELADYLEERLGKPADVLTEGGLTRIRIPEVATSLKEGIVYIQTRVHCVF